MIDGTSYSLTKYNPETRAQSRQVCASGFRLSSTYARLVVGLRVDPQTE